MSGKSFFGLLDVLLLLNTCHVTVPRDRIFVALGILERLKANAVAIKPNYERTCHEVYLETFRHCLKANQKLDVACMAGEIKLSFSAARLEPDSASLEAGAEQFFERVGVCLRTSLLSNTEACPTTKIAASEPVTAADMTFAIAQMKCPVTSQEVLEVSGLVFDVVTSMPP
jgi:hypothetical protein